MLARGSGFQVASVRSSREAGITVVGVAVRGLAIPSAQDVAAAQSASPSPPDASEPELRARFIRDIVITPRGPDIGRHGDVGTFRTSRARPGMVNIPGLVAAGRYLRSHVAS